MFHFMIDLENTRSRGLQGAEYLSVEDCVTIFYSQSCLKVEGGKLQQIMDAVQGKAQAAQTVAARDMNTVCAEQQNAYDALNPHRKN